jgi:hypothetical protein
MARCGLRRGFTVSGLKEPRISVTQLFAHHQNFFPQTPRSVTSPSKFAPANTAPIR